jgi:hypothetical protein
MFGRIKASTEVVDPDGFYRTNRKPPNSDVLAEMYELGDADDPANWKLLEQQCLSRLPIKNDDYFQYWAEILAVYAIDMGGACPPGWRLVTFAFRQVAQIKLYAPVWKDGIAVDVEYPLDD